MRLHSMRRQYHSVFGGIVAWIADFFFFGGGDRVVFPSLVQVCLPRGH